MNTIEETFKNSLSRLTISQFTQMLNELHGKSADQATHVLARWLRMSTSSLKISDEELADFKRTIAINIEVLRLNRLCRILYWISVLVPTVIMLIDLSSWLKWISVAIVGYLAVLNYAMSRKYRFPADVNPYGYNPDFAANSQRDMVFCTIGLIVLLSIGDIKIALISTAALLIIVRPLIPWPR